MAQKSILEKLAVLSDAAKYDASCASSSAPKRNSADGKGLGSSEGMGICHSYAPDGRCISLSAIWTGILLHRAAAQPASAAR